MCEWWKIKVRNVYYNNFVKCFNFIGKKIILKDKFYWDFIRRENLFEIILNILVKVFN